MTEREFKSEPLRAVTACEWCGAEISTLRRCEVCGWAGCDTCAPEHLCEEWLEVPK